MKECLNRTTNSENMAETAKRPVSEWAWNGMSREISMWLVNGWASNKWAMYYLFSTIIDNQSLLKYADPQTCSPIPCSRAKSWS